MLLDQEDYATTQRYAHLAPDAHDKVIQSWARRNDAPVTHGQRKPVPPNGKPACELGRGGRI
jgi:hypothetical protein